MQTATLELLERAKLPSEQVLALAQAIELEVASQRDAMVSRSDFLDLRGEFRSELMPLKTDVVQLKGDVADLKRDFAQLRDDVRDWKSEIRIEMHGMKAELVRWVFTVMLGQTAMLLGGGYFILSHFIT